MTLMSFGRVFSVCFWFNFFFQIAGLRVVFHFQLNWLWISWSWTFTGKFDCLQWIEWLNGRQLFQMNFDILKRVINDQWTVRIYHIDQWTPNLWGFQFLIESSCHAHLRTVRWLIESLILTMELYNIGEWNTFRIEFWISLNIQNEILYVLSVTVARIRYISSHYPNSFSIWI